MSNKIADYNLEDMLNELPIALDYEKDSNNAKLLSLFADYMEETLETLKTIDEWRDVDNAQGKALDMIGYDRNVARNGNDDNFYRFLIKVQQSQRTSDGTYNSIIRLLANALNANYSDINVQPMYVKGEPDAIEITNIPSDYVDDIRKKKLVMDKVQEIVALGIRVANLEFQTVVDGGIGVGAYSSVIGEVEVGTDMDISEREFSSVAYVRGAMQYVINQEIETETEG